MSSQWTASRNTGILTTIIASSCWVQINESQQCKDSEKGRKLDKFLLKLQAFYWLNLHPHSKGNLCNTNLPLLLVSHLQIPNNNNQNRSLPPIPYIFANISCKIFGKLNWPNNYITGMVLQLLLPLHLNVWQTDVFSIGPWCRRWPPYMHSGSLAKWTISFQVGPNYGKFATGIFEQTHFHCCTRSTGRSDSAAAVQL